MLQHNIQQRSVSCLWSNEGRNLFSAITEPRSDPHAISPTINNFAALRYQHNVTVLTSNIELVTCLLVLACTTPHANAAVSFIVFALKMLAFCFY